jgi:hypothetical protein
MKNYIFIILVVLFGYGGITSPNTSNKESENIIVQNSCPPYDEATGSTLLKFLTSDRFKENRQKAGIRKTEDVNPEDVILRDDTGQSSVCKKLREHFPWPRDHDFVSYFKIEDYYIVIMETKGTQPDEEGKINIRTGYSSMFVLDEEFNRVGQFLY